MVNIFAREITDDLASLVKQVDALVDSASEKGKDKTHAFVVLLTEDPDAMAPKLEALATKLGLKNTPLTIFDRASGPKNYKITKEADVTVLMWVGQEVTANYTFRKGKLNAAAVKKIVADAKEHLK